MTQALFDQAGNRKYLVAHERAAFVRAAVAEGGAVGGFCLTLAFTGARISEVLALTAERIDFGNGAIVFETLKQRKKGIFRAVPVPRHFNPASQGMASGKKGAYGLGDALMVGRSSKP